MNEVHWIALNENWDAIKKNAKIMTDDEFSNYMKSIWDGKNTSTQMNNAIIPKESGIVPKNSSLGNKVVKTDFFVDPKGNTVPNGNNVIVPKETGIVPKGNNSLGTVLKSNTSNPNIIELDPSQYRIIEETTENVSKQITGNNAIIPKGETAIVPKGNNAIIPKNTNSLDPLKSTGNLGPKIYEGEFTVLEQGAIGHNAPKQLTGKVAQEVTEEAAEKTASTGLKNIAKKGIEKAPLIGAIVAAGFEAWEEKDKVSIAFDESKGGGTIDGIKQLGKSALEVVGTGGGTYQGVIIGAKLGKSFGTPGVIIGGIVGGILGEKIGNKAGEVAGEAILGEECDAIRKDKHQKDLNDHGVNPSSENTSAAKVNSSIPRSYNDPMLAMMMQQTTLYDPTNPYMYALM